ncbi:hypothetical protein FACS1894122_06610 [Alphaproteobacteria bacterium]|nr:hypothetical protein FACS1894122_06610 [Alphaproteobacteria bacterium]
MKEYELIASLFKDVKDLFKSDAQIIEINGQKFGITCDTFSLEEDLFTDDDLYLLGCNLVTATVSDSPIQKRSASSGETIRFATKTSRGVLKFNTFRGRSLSLFSISLFRFPISEIDMKM